VNRASADEQQALLTYVLRLGDNALIMGQRMIERVAGEPELEEELANANFALDYIGQARLFYSYAGELEGNGRSEDDFAFMRDGREFRNFLLCEQTNGHFGDNVVRQFLFESFYLLQLQALSRCGNQRLAEIAARGEKEIQYHLRNAAHWVVRLGDGTEFSHERVQASLNRLWRFTGEFFSGDDADDVARDCFDGPDLEALSSAWTRNVAAVLEEATLIAPADEHMAIGGREGIHSEAFGFLIAEMQHLQRAYPGATW
jgi:ring-1,2-phenylacetyl-CoA epoxidase subunit PaaC